MNDRKFRFFKFVLDPPTMKNVRAATSSDPAPVETFKVEDDPPFNPSFIPVWLKSANHQSNRNMNATITEAAKAVTKLKSRNFWLALILSISGLVLSIIFTMCIIKRYFVKDRPVTPTERRQIEWLRNVPTSFKEKHLSPTATPTSSF
jgi:hypothetical protein